MLQKIKLGYLHTKKLGFIATISYFFQRLFLKKDALIKLKIPFVTDRILLRNKSYDTHIFYQIFIKEDLAFVKKMQYPVNVIIDAGANIGLSTIYLKNIFPRAAILSIEPSATNFEILKKNVANYAGIVLFKGAVMGEAQHVSITNPEDNYASFRVMENNSSGNITAHPLSYFIRQFGLEKIDFIKMDIEGSEKDVFEKIDTHTLSKIRAFAIEVHEHLVPGTFELITQKLSMYNQIDTAGEFNYFIKN